MKTEASTGDVIWTNVELPHLAPEECLPVIGSGTVSSVLPNLDGAPIDNILQNNNLDAQQHSSLIILEDSYKVTQQVRSSKTNSQKTSKKVKEQNCLEDILYFVCNSCPFLCTKDSKITEHVENAHKNQTEVKLLELKCPACPNIFYHKVSLRSHLIHDHGVGNSELSNIIQSIVYFAKKNQTKASESHKVEAKVVSVPQDGLNCKNELDAECSKESENEAGRDNNNRNATDQNCHQEIVILPTLDLTQSNAERMFTNIIKGDGIVKYSDQRSVYKCIAPLCKAAFQDVQKLNYHMASHNDTSFKCLECDEIFSFWKPLTGHLWRMHKIDMELYSCDKCDYKTYSLSKLNNIHKLIHSDVKAFACIVCQKSFKNKKQLRNHKMTHTEKSKKVVHTCEVCNKTFFDKRQMKVHMDGVHKKIKPFLCSYCGYKGASKSALKMHIRQHTGEKPFECDACDYTTADHNSLRRHKLRHTGEKPYKCAHCDYSCIQSSTYKVHLKTKHPGLEKNFVFVCCECQFRSVSKDVYMLHLASIHKKNVYA